MARSADPGPRAGRRRRDDSFREFVVDQLRGLPEVAALPMFGGHGLYLGESFFGIIHASRLYFRTDERSRAAYLDLGMKAFRPRPGTTLGTYYEVPVEVLESCDELKRWAVIAARTSRTPRPRPVSS